MEIFKNFFEVLKLFITILSFFKLLKFSRKFFIFSLFSGGVFICGYVYKYVYKYVYFYIIYTFYAHFVYKIGVLWCFIHIVMYI